MKHTRIIVTYYGGPDALQVLEEECPEQEKGTGYFSTSFRGPSSSPQHRRKTVPTSKTLSIVITIGERQQAFTAKCDDVIYGMSKPHPDRKWQSTVRGDGKSVLFGVS